MIIEIISRILLTVPDQGCKPGCVP